MPPWHISLCPAIRSHHRRVWICCPILAQSELEVSRKLKLLAEDQPSGWAQPRAGSVQEPDMWRCRVHFCGTRALLSPREPPRQLSPGRPLALPLRGLFLYRRHTEKAPASSPAAGLGDVMRSSQTLHKPLELVLQPYLPGQSAATAEVSVLRLLTRVRVKNAHVNPTSADIPSHRGWHLGFLVLLNSCGLLIWEGVTKTLCKPVDLGVLLSSQVCVHATAAAPWPHVTVRSGRKPAFSLLLHLGFSKKKSQPAYGSRGRTGELRPSHEQDRQVQDTREAHGRQLLLSMDAAKDSHRGALVQKCIATGRAGIDFI